MSGKLTPEEVMSPYERFKFSRRQQNTLSTPPNEYRLMLDKIATDKRITEEQRAKARLVIEAWIIFDEAMHEATQKAIINLVNEIK